MKTITLPITIYAMPSKYSDCGYHVDAVLSKYHEDGQSVILKRVDIEVTFDESALVGKLSDNVETIFQQRAFSLESEKQDILAALRALPAPESK
jgi:hypothetical protein